ncbi:MAG: enoyl-CoA hydratase-related protein [Desulfuromonadales bacterium]|nr:enoyl-CoA hydratase-related protein [Desulfuromonadales bacterium]
MSEKYLDISYDNGVATVSLNRPCMGNAINESFIEELEEAFNSLNKESSVKGVLITGAGKHFCAGADIGGMLPLSPVEATRFASKGQKLMFTIAEFSKPVIAAVNGAAMGGGLELALSCDFIVAAETARFAFPEINLGIIPGFGGTQRLTRLIGRSKAKQMVFTGAAIEAREALRIGLINSIFPDESLIYDALTLLHKICDKGLLSLRMAKEVINRGYDLDLANACFMERDAFAICFSSEDQKEGMTAFMEKRKPVFKGR